MIKKNTEIATKKIATISYWIIAFSIASFLFPFVMGYLIATILRSFPFPTNLGTLTYLLGIVGFFENAGLSRAYRLESISEESLFRYGSILLLITLTILLVASGILLGGVSMEASFWLIFLVTGILSLVGRVILVFAFWRYSREVGKENNLLKLGGILTPVIFIPLLDTFGILLLALGLYKIKNVKLERPKT
ncbi:MAG: hypothetical protein GWO20_15080 [Candidatus Korarchaeota archaeon]|nr:hypothetical protein [Candidatus Korarchaeota archaeon]NIU83741.1 hypothetical protein [Candidatus Thorarchaeota archaeon]NIW15694.1 hypothetical protein [Candidatus Thorarchaeota archaeon]NIW52058.1 hypothetical protein [Candidatus Korarchaeota archaeon]